MIRFRQKSFALPLLAAGTVGNILNAGVVGTTLASIGVGMSDMKKQEAMAAEKAKNDAATVKALNNVAKAAEANPGVAQAVTNVLSDRAFSKTKAIIDTAKQVGGVVKDIGKVVVHNRHALIGGTIVGGVGAGVSYGVDKGIQYDVDRDIKKATQMNQRAYSLKAITPILKKAKDVAKVVKSDVGKAAKKSKSGMILVGTLSAVPTVGGYMAEKMAMKDNISATQQPLDRSYSAASGILGGITKGINAAKSIKPAEVFGKVKTGLTNFKKDPGTPILSGLSTITGGGGKKGVEKFGRLLKKAGKNSKNEMTQKLGQYIVDNPKKSLAGSTIVGTGVLSATWGTGDKVVRKTAERLDKNAFAYQKSKEEIIN